MGKLAESGNDSPGNCPAPVVLSSSCSSPKDKTLPPSPPPSLPPAAPTVCQLAFMKVHEDNEDYYGQYQYLRFLHIIFNVIYGVAAMCTVAFTNMDTVIFERLSEHFTHGALIVSTMIILSCLTSLVLVVFSIFAFQIKNGRLLSMCTVTTTHLLVVQLVLATLIGILRSPLESKIDTWMRGDVSCNITKVEVWKFFQSKYDCCGYKGPIDYMYIGQAVDVTCCPYKSWPNDINYTLCMLEQNFYKNGCQMVVMSKMHFHGIMILVTGIIVMVFEVFSVYVSYWALHFLMKMENIKNRKIIYKSAIHEVS